TLGRDLTDEDVTVDDLGTDADDAAFVEVGEDFLADVGDLAGDLLGAQLGLARVDLVFLDVDRGEDVLFDQALGQHDGVLVVVALPGHVRHEEVLAERHLTGLGGRSVGEHLAFLDPLAFFDDGALVEAGALVGAAELVDPVGLAGAVVGQDGDVVGGDVLDDTGLLRQDDVAGVGGRAVLHTGTHERGLGTQQWHRLTLHVGAHERPVGVVVLQERDHGGGDRHHLPRGDVHVVDFFRGDGLELPALAACQHLGLREGPVGVDRGVRLGDDVPVLFVRGEVDHLVGDPAVDHLAVGGLDEPEGVDPGVGRKRADEADVRAFRCLDRAHAAVVRRVDVADLEARPLTGQTARSQRGEAALVGQAGQRVGLVHELGELAGAEKLPDGGDDRTDVDQRLRRYRLDVLGGHALPDDPFHAGQPQADLVLDELTDGTQPAVTEVVDVVDLDREGAVRTHQLLLPGVQPDEVVDGGDDVLFGERPLGDVDLQPQLLVDLVAADLGEVVALGVEVQVFQQSLRGLLRGRLARAELAVDVQQRVVGPRSGVLLQGGADGLVLAEAFQDLVGGPAQRLEQDGDSLLALAVDTDT